PASIVVKPANRNIHVSERETVELECKPKGFPTPSIRWIGPNRNPLSNHSMLTINNISPFQSGFYTCIAENEVGNPKFEQYNIQVHHIPTLTVKENEIYTGTELKVTMTCYILSNPKPKVHWMKIKSNANEANTIFDISPSIININDTFFQSALEITISAHSDLGTYECRANNGIGENGAKV
ncbi:lachesin-like protein, partial [Leptotrombidium deliense]